MTHQPTGRSAGCSQPSARSSLRAPSWSAARATNPRKNRERRRYGGLDRGAAGGNDEPGETVTIGFSGPAADHGWLAAINSSAQEAAEKYEDIDFRSAEGTNDPSLQISQIETFINEGVDAIVLLPTDGAALTDVAIEAMQAGIPVVNVDREFSSPVAARSTILGDNYGMGVSAGTYSCQLIEENGIADPGDRRDRGHRRPPAHPGPLSRLCRRAVRV